jgi:hypothetical protein
LNNHIRPLGEQSKDDASSEPASDARAAEFMNSLRARISSQDEAQEKSWVEKVVKPKPVVPMTPGNPTWMNPPEKKQAVAKPSANDLRSGVKKRPVRR